MLLRSIAFIDIFREQFVFPSVIMHVTVVLYYLSSYAYKSCDLLKILYYLFFFPSRNLTSACNYIHCNDFLF